MNSWQLEPVRIVAIVRAGVVLAASFGLSLTQEQAAALYLLVELVSTEIARAQVEPVKSDRRPHRVRR